MAQAQAAVLNVAIEEAAIKATFGLQYNTAAAANFVQCEVPTASYEMAIQAINRVIRPSRKFKKSK